MNNLRNFPPVTLGIFQSTLLQEERLKLKYIQNGNSYFNPRSYKRSNCNGEVCTWKDCNFNPRSYKRSDEINLPVAQEYYFNPRSYKRSDQLSRKLILFASYFNPRSYKRSDAVHSCPLSEKESTSDDNYSQRISPGGSCEKTEL